MTTARPSTWAAHSRGPCSPRSWSREGRVVPVVDLVDAIWGEAPPSSASGVLQSYVSRLRRVLEPSRRRGAAASVLVTEAPGYRLALDHHDVDFRRFERLADEGRSRLEAGAADEARHALVEAQQLWRGPALVEFSTADFAQGMATRLEERRLLALEDRIDADLLAGRHDAVIGELAELIRAHPLRERGHGQLALALYRAGRQAEALRAIENLRRTLREELGVDPSPPIRSLENRILDHDASLVLALGTARATGDGRSKQRARGDATRLPERAVHRRRAVSSAAPTSWRRCSLRSTTRRRARRGWRW